MNFKREERPLPKTLQSHKRKRGKRGGKAHGTTHYAPRAGEGAPRTTSMKASRPAEALPKRITGWINSPNEYSLTQDRRGAGAIHKKLRK